MRLAIIFLFIAALMPCSSILAQDEPCDFNENGIIDVGDFSYIIGMIGGGDGIDGIPEYYFEWDCDRDKIHLTVSDLFGLTNRLIYGYEWGYGRQLESCPDTIFIPEIEASPGDEIDIPVYIKTNRLFLALQFYVGYDPEIIDLSDFIFPDSIPPYLPSGSYLFDGGVSVVRIYSEDTDPDSLIGYLRVHIFPDSPEGSSAFLKFGNDPHRALYTGLASEDDFNDSPGLKLFFVHPVKIDGVIRIIDDGDLRSDEGPRLPVDFRFSPNPFNNSTRLAFRLRENTPVKVAIYDLLGRQVALLVDGNLPSGRHDILWDAGYLPSGIYLCRLKVGDMEATEKITLLK